MSFNHDDYLRDLARILDNMPPEERESRLAPPPWPGYKDRKPAKEGGVDERQTQPE